MQNSYKCVSKDINNLNKNQYKYMKRDSKITNYIKKICKNLNNCFTAISIKKLSNKCTITMIWYNKNEKLDKG